MEQYLDFDAMPKVAFIGGLIAPLSRMAAPVGRAIAPVTRYLGSSGSNPLLQKAMPYVTRGEQALARGVGKVAPQYAEGFGRAIRGAGRAAVRGAYGGAVSGAALGGIGGALTAPEGERMQGFLSGAGTGALTGGVGGMVSGGAGAVIRNRNAGVIQNMARAQGVSAGNVGKQFNNMPLFWGEEGNRSALRSVFNKQDPMRQQVAKARLAAGGLGTAAWLASEKAQKKVGPEPPPPPPAVPPAPVQPHMLANMPAAYYPQQRVASYNGRLNTPDFSRLVR